MLPEVPKNTSVNTHWVIRNFTDWFAAHNSNATMGIRHLLFIPSTFFSA